MIAEFKTESAALDFMSFLMEYNNQGNKNVLYGWADDGENVEYNFNEYVIHESIFKQIEKYLEKNENK